MTTSAGAILLAGQVPFRHVRLDRSQPPLRGHQVVDPPLLTGGRRAQAQATGTLMDDRRRHPRANRARGHALQPLRDRGLEPLQGLCMTTDLAPRGAARRNERRGN
jgi:hypothetical protein